MPLVELDQERSSYSVLATLVVLGLAAFGLHRSGVIGWALGVFGATVRWAIRSGFRTWEVLLSGLSTATFAGVIVGLLVVGSLLAGTWPGVTILAALGLVVMGGSACLAYMFIDIERYEVERGYKAVHNPLKGQHLAANLARYGHQVGVLLMVVASVGMVGGFALLNQGLYEAGGQHWYRVGDPDPRFVDFLVYALVNMLRVVDVLDIADSKAVVHTVVVRPAGGPPALLLTAFKSFFTMVLLQQIFASIRQGRLLAETIADFWSPHEPIHDRARNALPQFGAAAVGPLLVSLRETTALTKEQRDQLPPILAAMGPATVPVLVAHLRDSHEHVRVVAALSLGHLAARDAVTDLAELLLDASGPVRQAVAEALGMIAARAAKDRTPVRRATRARRFRWRWGTSTPARRATDPVATAVVALRALLGDDLAGVRGQAAASLHGIGAAAADAADVLAWLLKDADETVRGQAAEAIGKCGGPAEASVVALTAAIDDSAAAVRAAAARGLGSLGDRACAAVPKLVALIQDRDDAVRDAAANALAKTGPLSPAATAELVAGLASPDNVVRARTAEALGVIGEPARGAVPALTDALRDGNDVVRAKAVEALGKMGVTAGAAVPSLVHALRDRDSWVSALAAEALGEMGASAGDAIPALVRALGHVNPRVRANATEAIGKLGPPAASARGVLERIAADDDAGVRAEAVRALGLIGPPIGSTLRLVHAALADADSAVRAAAVEAVGGWDRDPAEVLKVLVPLLADSNDAVKVQALKVLARQPGLSAEVVAEFARLLSDDDGVDVRTHAAAALARVGAAAVTAGPTLLRAALTGEIAVREQAMRALAVVQPPEAEEAFVSGLKDACPTVRLIASAGWTNAAAVPERAVAGLVDALLDPESQVRANAALALGRLDALPPAAVPLLLENLTDANVSLRMNAAVALRSAPFADTADALRHLLADPNARVRLAAAGAVLRSDPGDAAATAVATAALSDASPRVREAAAELLANAPETPAAAA